MDAKKAYNEGAFIFLGNKFRSVRSWCSKHTLGIVLLIGLTHGLLYVFLVPPWRHYDEPSHFEYAWWIANRHELPEVGDYDQAMRREVAASMVEHDFFDNLNYWPNLVSQYEPVWISPTSKLNDAPLYYLLTSIPLRLLRFTDITLQMYATRLVSLALYLLSILIAWKVVAELVPEGHPLRWMVPATLVLLPGFVDIMTAVNNDVGATAALSFFLWGAVRLMRRGFSLKGLFWVLGTTIMCAYTKKTALVALPLFPICMLFTFLRNARQRITWGLLVVVFLIIVITVFSWGDAALWYRLSDQSSPTRISRPEAPYGEYAIGLEVLPSSPPPTLFQFLPWRQVTSYGGKTLTLGAWVWATRPLILRAPFLTDGYHYDYEDIEIGAAPSFFAFSSNLVEDAFRVRVELAPIVDPIEKPLTVFYDGLVLVEGSRPVDEVPTFTDANGKQGVWGGEPFSNIIRNASAEEAWPSVRPWANNLGSTLFPGKPSNVLSSILDWPGSSWYYQATAENILRTFWAKFGWGGVTLLGHKPYRPLLIITLIGLAGAGLAISRKRRDLPWDIMILLVFALIGTWVPALVRSVESLIAPRSIFIPGARYAYPSIIPTALVLNLGWLEVFNQIRGRLRVPYWVGLGAYFLSFMALDTLALLSLTRYFSNLGS